MANYHCAVRTNRFHVIDETQFLEYMARVEVDGGEIKILHGKDSAGSPTYGFRANGLILGVSDYSEESVSVDEDMYDNFIAGLQEIVAYDDAIIILEVGFSNADDLSSTATIITTFDTDYIDLQEVASDRAIELLTDIR